jgi:1-phosphofructokinase family hexose kinase
MILAVCPNPSVDTRVTLSQITPGGVHRAEYEEHFPGGKGVHVAMAVRELGCDVQLLGFWAGPTGDWVRGQCGQLNIPCHGPAVQGWTRTCLTLQTPHPYNETELLGVGPTLNKRDMAGFSGEFERLLPMARIVTLSGSWPRGAGDSSYADLVAMAKIHRKPVILDCTGPSLKAALKHRPDAVHLNAAEASALLDLNDPIQSAKALSEQCGLAVVTCGAKGAYFIANGAILHAVCRIESQFSAVGSGDCLVAGLAVAHVRQLALDQTAALACACGAANCLSPELGMLRRRDVERLMPQVEIRKLS